MSPSTEAPAAHRRAGPVRLTPAYQVPAVVEREKGGRRSMQRRDAPGRASERRVIGMARSH
jgi:hypothetical protein